MKSKSKDYIKGFRHGVAWACQMFCVYSIQIKKIDIDKAVESLKAGR